jgi:phage portal protein BeeE
MTEMIRDIARSYNVNHSTIFEATAVTAEQP